MLAVAELSIVAGEKQVELDRRDPSPKGLEDGEEDGVAREPGDRQVKCLVGANEGEPVAARREDLLQSLAQRKEILGPARPRRLGGKLGLDHEPGIDKMKEVWFPVPDRSFEVRAEPVRAAGPIELLQKDAEARLNPDEAEGLRLQQGVADRIPSQPERRRELANGRHAVARAIALALHEVE